MSNKVTSADNQQERLLTRYGKMSPHYVVGLVDGEGYFSVSTRMRKYPTYTTREVDMVFGIDIKESDGEILAKVQKFLECGNINHKTDKRENFCNQVMYQVRSHKDNINKIIPFFSKHPLQIPSKQKEFKYFVEIGKIVKNKEHLTYRGFNKVERLKREMRQ